jgi:tetratricopeptide (TPR) repeat protein
MSSSRETHVVVLCLVLVAATLAFYSPLTHNQFIAFDDSSYILQNPWVQNGLTWNTVKWSLTTFRDGNWHPLTWLSHALDCQLFHLNPVGHHNTSLLLHAANAVLLFLLLRRATGLTWPSLFAGALFALHPINVESVAWAAERKNVLSMFFFLLALHAYDRYARTGKRSSYIAVAVCFALGLMAKPQIVTLPFVLLLWDYWPLGRLAARGYERGSEGGSEPGSPVPRSFVILLRETLPLFLLAIADSVVTVIAQRAGHTVRTFTEVSFAARWENILVSYARYLGKAFWPTRLAPMYPRPEGLLPAGQVAGAIFLLLVISALVLRWREHRYLLFGWLWFLGTLVPMIGIVTVGEQSMADRYAYLPFVGLFVAVVWGARDLAARFQIPTAWRAAAAVVVVFVLGCLTHRQIAHWHDEETLWRYTLTVTAGNYVAHNDLALLLARQNRDDEAVAQFEAAAAEHQYPAPQVLTLAAYELRVGHVQEGIGQAEATLQRSNSSDPKVQAAAWTMLGQAHMQLHDYDQSEASYQQALRLNPEETSALIGSGLLALRREDFNAAINQFDRAVKVDPSDVNFLLRGQALRRAGRSADADSANTEARKVSKNFSQAQITAAQLLNAVGLKPQ